MLVVGLGTIARTHLAVLERRGDVTVVGGVDPRGGTEMPFPVHPDVDAALAGGSEPDLVVVATPTDTHVGLVTELLARTAATVLSEKPLARTRADLEALRATLPPAALEARLKVAHHFAFSPEVEWARATALAHPEWGKPTRVLSVFNDAYAAMAPGRRAGYVSTWVDSAPNQLSLLAPFATDWKVVAHSDEGDRAATVLDHGGGRTVLTSNWLAADTSKQTALEFRGGEVEVRIDHTSMTGLLLRDGQVVEHAGYAGRDGRKVAHYLGLYDVLLSRPDDERLGVPLAARIAALLEEGERLRLGGSRARWTSLTSAG